MPDTSLLSLILTLRPLAAAKDLNALGRASHALLLDAVRWSDPALAEELHAGDGLRPFTASDLIGYSRRQGLSPGQTYTLRFTTLTEPVARALAAAAREGPLRVGASLNLDGTALRIESISNRGAWIADRSEVYDPQSAIGDPKSDIQHSWAAATTYEALSAPWLLGRAQPESRLTLCFASPTTFKSAGRHVPVPLPDLVFGSLLERWNAFAPVALPTEVRRYADECLALGAYRLRTRMVQVKDGGLRAGAIGQARYVAISHDRYWLSLINLLADFAFYAGVGAGTTTGLGQCRKIADDRSRDATNPRASITTTDSGEP